MRRAKWIAIIAGTLLTVFLVGTALADPPTPTKPANPATAPAGGWEAMRDWMDSRWGQGFFDRMHGSSEGMVETCNTMMGSGGMMDNGGMMGSGGMMGPGTGMGTQSPYGGMMGPGNTPTRSGGRGTMMGNFMGRISY